MTKTGSKVIPLLNQFVERLDSLSLNDREGWSALACQLAELQTSIPGQMKPLRSLLETCRKALEAVAQKSLSDYLAIIDAIADGFEAAQYYLDNFATVAQAVEATKSLQVQPIEILTQKALLVFIEPD